MLLGKWMAIALCIAALGGAAALAQYRSIEKPAYETLVTDEAFELRDYAPMIVAEVTHTGDQRRALSSGFRRLAAYIFAEDRPGAEAEKIAMTSPVLHQRQSEKIAMTSPVLQNSEQGERWRTRFVMPSKYTLEVLPEPPADITLTQVPARRMASIAFNGYGGQRDLIAMELLLREWMAENDLVPSGHAEFAFYDAPMVPGPMRRNEVLIPVASD